jgi:hypothetical protein
MVIKSVGFSPSLFSLYYLHFTFRINNFSIYFFIVHLDAVLTSLFFLSSIFIFPFFQIFCVRRLLIFNNLHLRFPPCSYFFNCFSRLSFFLSTTLHIFLYCLSPTSIYLLFYSHVTLSSSFQYSIFNFYSHCLNFFHFLYLRFYQFSIFFSLLFSFFPLLVFPLHSLSLSLSLSPLPLFTSTLILPFFLSPTCIFIYTLYK